MRFQVASDIHIECFKPGQPISSVITPTAPNLIVAGDLGRVESPNFKLVVKELCSMFKTVIFIAGNHEYYSMGPKKTNMEDIDLYLRGLCLEEKNLIILNNNTTVVDNVLIFGSTFWSYCPQQHFIPSQLYKNGKIVNANEYNKMHAMAIQSLKETIEYASGHNLKLLVVTHHAPSFDGTLAAHHITDNNAPAKGNMKNYMYCSSNLTLVNDPVIIAWVYGHTGYNGNVGKLVTNQMDKPTGIKNAVLTVNLPQRVPMPLPPAIDLFGTDRIEKMDLLE